MMIVFRVEAAITGRTLGQMSATLDDTTIDAHGLRAPLASLGLALADQLNIEGRDELRGRVVGVELVDVSFVVLLGPRA